MDEHINRIKDAVLERDVAIIETLVETALNNNTPPQAIINQAIIPAMDLVGKRFSSGEIFLPEMLVSAVATKKVLGIVKPLYRSQENKSKGLIVIGTVSGDLHDIGKNIVIMMLESGGFTVVDLGVDLAEKKIIEAVKQIRPNILGLSALLTTTMPGMESVIQALRDQGLKEQLKVIVGGAPVDDEFAKKIGADGYAQNAPEAVTLCKQLLEQNN